MLFLEKEGKAKELTVSLAISRSGLLSEDVPISFSDELEAFFFAFPFLLVLPLFSAIAIVILDVISLKTIGVSLYIIA